MTTCHANLLLLFISAVVTKLIHLGVHKCNCNYLILSVTIDLILNIKLFVTIHKAEWVIHGNLNLVLFCFLFSDLRLFLISLGQVKSVLMAFTACPFWWSNTALLFWESSPSKHDSKDHVQWNAVPKFLHNKTSDLFENGDTMSCEISGWSMVV